MKEHLSLYFLLSGLLLSGVLVTSCPYIRDEKSLVEESRLWIASIACAVVAFFFFGIGTFITKEAIKSNSIIFTFANTIYLAAIVFQTLFCKSLNNEVSKKTILIGVFLLLVFGLHFEYLRGSGNFVGRVLEVAILSTILYVAQLIWLLKKLRLQNSTQLKLLTVFTFCELGTIVLRVYLAATQVNQVQAIGEIPFPLVAALWLNISFNVLSFLTMSGYWSEQSSIRRTEMRLENDRIKHLLDEREHLIGSLLLANKSAITGALSAFFAHELNQPIGASRINLFSLRKILKDYGKSDEALNTIVAHLESDNQRAGNIVGALRSMFARQPLETKVVELSSIVSQASSLVNGECVANRISLNINIPPHLMVTTSSVELQQVLLNLLNNCINALKDFESSTKKIWIAVSPSKEGFIDLCVEDNGPGVNPDIASNLFDLFATKGSGGMGVGLWLCKYIMEYCGGFIRYSPRQGGGSQFAVSIPVK